MAASVAFYKSFFEQEPDGGQPERFAIFIVGNTGLALYDLTYDDKFIENGADLGNHFNSAYLENKETVITYGNNTVLNLTVPDLVAEYERVKRLNIGKVSELMYVNIAMPYWFFWLTDPDGNCLEITGEYKP
jgi:lactoylglutathione lyase